MVIKLFLEEKKRMRRYYYLVGSSVRGGASGARRSPERGGALSGGGSDTKRKIRKGERQHRRVKFLLPRETSSSRSLVRVDTAHDRDGIERSGSTPIFAYP